MINLKNFELPYECLENYIEILIPEFFKILPIYEEQPSTLKEHLESLLIELLGNKSLIKDIQNDAQFLRLTGTLQYFIDNECSHAVYRREAFKCIGIVEKLKKKYWIERRD